MNIFKHIRYSTNFISLHTFPRPLVLPHGDRFLARLGVDDIQNLLHFSPGWPLPLFPTGLPCCLDLTCSSLWFSNTFPLLHLVSILRKGTCKVKYWNSKYLKKIPWRRACQPTPVFLPGEFYGQRNMVGYSLWGRRVGHYWPTHTHPHWWE